MSLLPSKHNKILNLPTIETKRLLIRKMRISDAKDMYEYASRDDVTKYLLWSSHEDINQTKAFLAYAQKQYKRGEYVDFSIELKSDSKMIGTIGFVQIDFENLSSEVGYVINPNYQNKGYAKEALKAILSFGFEKLHLNRIEANFMIQNEASRHVMEKCNMNYEGCQKEKMFIKGMFRDIGTCAILREDYYKNVKND